MATFSTPNTIQDGQPIAATPVAQNFAAVEQFINDEVIHRDGSVVMTGPLILSDGNEAVSTDRFPIDGGTDIENLTITGSKIATRSINANRLELNSITASEIGPGAVNTSELVDGAVTAGKLASNSVVEAKIASGAVTTAKIGNGAVTEAKLADSTVSGSTSTVWYTRQRGIVTVGGRLNNNAVFNLPAGYRPGTAQYRGAWVFSNGVSGETAGGVQVATNGNVTTTGGNSGATVGFEVSFPAAS